MRKKSVHILLWIVVIVSYFLALFSYLLLGSISSYFDVQRTELVDVPYYLTKEINYSMPFEKETCEDESYRYSTESGNVEKIGIYVRPHLELSNLEENWGRFLVTFHYISEADFPYDVYGGESLEEKYDKGEITLEDAKFASEPYSLLIGPKESIMIDFMTIDTAKEASYWAIADIIEPRIQRCMNRVMLYNSTQNRTFTEYRKEARVKTVKQFMTLKEYYKISSLGQWIVLITMLFLILILLGLIFQRVYWIISKNKRIDIAQR